MSGQVEHVPGRDRPDGRRRTGGGHARAPSPPGSGSPSSQWSKDWRPSPVLECVHEELVRRGEPVGLSTVYRSLHALAERGTLDAVRGQDGEMLYRRCMEAPHHHLVCRRCGVAVEVPGATVHRTVDRWARAAGFVDTEVVLEVFGVCPGAAQPDSPNESHS